MIIWKTMHNETDTFGPGTTFDIMVPPVIFGILFMLGKSKVYTVCCSQSVNTANVDIRYFFQSMSK